MPPYNYFSGSDSKIVNLIERVVIKNNFNFHISDLKYNKHIFKQYENIQKMSRRQRLLKKKYNIPSLKRTSQGDKIVSFEQDEIEISFEIISNPKNETDYRVLCVNISDGIKPTRCYDPIIMLTLN